MNERLYVAIDNWLKNYKKNSVKTATYDRLRVSFGLMLRYPISNEFPDEMTSDDIQRYLNRLVDDGYALSTIRKQFTLLTAFLKWAHANGKITTPIYLGVSIPIEDTVKKPAKEIETFNMAEQRKLLNVLETLEHRTYGALILMLEAGLRSGEAQCLTWDDVLWDRRALRINKTLVRCSTKKGFTFVQNSAKSKTSNRTVPLSNRAMRVLSALADKTKNLDGLIFPSNNDDALPISHFVVRYYLRKACELSGVKYHSAHALRHTFATNCYNRGCDVKILSKLLGHADVAITYNIYIHLYGDALEEMRKVIG